MKIIHIILQKKIILNILIFYVIKILVLYLILVKKIYPISLLSSPNIYNEMYDFWKSKCKILPTNRFINSSNKYLYTNRFKEQAWNKYYLYKDILYYIKKLGCNRNIDGELVDITKCDIKKIPYIYEVISLKNFMMKIIIYQKIKYLN